MDTLTKEPATAADRVKQRLIGAAIVIGGLLMITGCLLTVLWELKGGEALYLMWPFYLGGVVAVLLGWLNSEFRTLQ